jgi:hypothetical protein
MPFRKLIGACVVITCLSVQAVCLGAPPESEALKVGDTVKLNGHTVVFKRLVDLPYVESKYTKLFKFDSYENPRLKQLRDRYKLEEVVAAGKTEFEKQTLLLYWVNDQFKKFGRPTSEAHGALDVLTAVENGHTFYCTHYCEVLISGAASLGWIDRAIGLKRPSNIGSGFMEHSITEIWSNQYSKWVMLDPLYALYTMKDGVPLNAYELRQEWFYNEGKDLVMVVGKDRKEYRKADLPIFRGHFPGFGNLELNASSFHLYAFIEYFPNANLMTASEDSENSLIFTDRVSEGTTWHLRPAPENPASDVYFPLDQVSLKLVPTGSHLRADMKSLTPNFQTYQVRIDRGEWKLTEDTFSWNMHPGTNHLEARTMNKFGVTGPVSTTAVDVQDQ